MAKSLSELNEDLKLKVSEHEATIGTLEGKNKELTDANAKLAGEKLELEKKLSDQATSDETIKKLTEDNKKISDEFEAYKKGSIARTEFDAKVEETATAKSQQTLSSLGIKPIEVKPTTKPGAEDPNKGKLKGRERIAAAAESETAEFLKRQGGQA